jgi:hypothetical protein
MNNLLVENWNFEKFFFSKELFNLYLKLEESFHLDFSKRRFITSIEPYSKSIEFHIRNTLNDRQWVDFMFFANYDLNLNVIPFIYHSSKVIRKISDLSLSPKYLDDFLKFCVIKPPVHESLDFVYDDSYNSISYDNTFSKEYYFIRNRIDFKQYENSRDFPIKIYNTFWKLNKKSIEDLIVSLSNLG